MDDDGEKLADITLVQPQDDQHGQHVITKEFLIIVSKNIIQFS